MTRIKELRERSPLRLFERSLHGGLGRGNLGVVCAGHGVGKTAFLVCIALDHLMRGHQVLHIALDQPVDRVRNYYDEIYAELVRTENLENAAETRVEVERNRRIHTYQEHCFSVESLHTTLDFMHKHTDLAPTIMVLDGFEWENGTDAELRELKKIAQERNVELWMSAQAPRDEVSDHPRGYPVTVAPLESWLDVIVRLLPENGTVRLTLLKERDNPEPASVSVSLDPTTLLLVNG